MKIYIAGKITGNPDYKAQFAQAEAQLLEKGHSVMNPARLLVCREFTYADYITVSQAMQSVCHAVFFLPNWKDSSGAIAEYDHAFKTRQKIYFDMQDVKSIKKGAQ
ncbi:MAG: DUF4406 domain-containing protein [Treponema sp.]